MRVMISASAASSNRLKDVVGIKVVSSSRLSDRSRKIV